MKNIDLSKCEIGKKLKRRDGKIVTFDGRMGHLLYPFQIMEGPEVYTRRGQYFSNGEESLYDIVEILPLTDKVTKTAKKEKPAPKVWTAKQRATIRRIMKLMAELDEHTEEITK